MSRKDYDRLIGELEATGVGEPEGRAFHAANGEDEVHMSEVWDTRLPGKHAYIDDTPTERSGPCAAGSPIPDPPSS
jgi:hypothetical protein